MRPGFLASICILRSRRRRIAAPNRRELSRTASANSYLGNPKNDKDSFSFRLVLGAVSQRLLANAASANDRVDMGCTDGCSQCGAAVCSCPDYSFCEQAYLFPQNDCGFNLRGWVDAGIIGNTSDPDSRFNGPSNAVDRSNATDDEPVLPDRCGALPQCGWGVGGRVDVMYGEDFWLAESTGFDDIRPGPRISNPEYYGS